MSLLVHGKGEIPPGETRKLPADLLTHQFLGVALAAPVGEQQQFAPVAEKRVQRLCRGAVVQMAVEAVDAVLQPRPPG